MTTSFDQDQSHSGIQRTPGVCGGSARIAGTRIAVWTLEEWRRLGAQDCEILRNLPNLTAADLRHAWSYISVHQAEIDNEIIQNQEAEL